MAGNNNKKKNNKKNNVKPEVSYVKVYGCPKHGSEFGQALNIKTTNNKTNELLSVKPAFFCKNCKKIYLQTSSGSTGKAEKQLKISGYDNYETWYTTGPLPVPSSIYVFEKSISRSKLCKCPGKFTDKTMSISHFLLKNGKTVPVQGTKICQKCKKVFVTTNAYENQKSILNDNISTIEYIGNADPEKKSKLDKTSIEAPPKEITKSISFPPIVTSSLEGWEEEVFAEDIDSTEVDISSLVPASKVASAYYDAKIDYNPYQYLPWLKMFCNGVQSLLISDEVGLGKTIEAGILIMEELAINYNSKIIVVCPAFLREKWYQELHEKFLYDPQIYDGKSVIDSYTNIVILPISRIKQYIEQGNDFDYNMVIVDEVHYFKNAKSSRYASLKKLLDLIGHVKYVFMSATPINNNGNDYHSIEKLFCDKPEKTNTTKKQAYIDLPGRHIHDVSVNYSPEEQQFYDLTDLLDPFSGTIYRHIGASCLYALSRYAYTNNEVLTETKDELRAAIESLSNGYDLNDDDIYLPKLKKMDPPNVDSKLNAMKDVIRSYESGSRIVIFSHYIETVKYLHSELAKEFSVGYIYADNVSSNIPCKHVKDRFIDAKEWFSGRFAETVILICSDSCKEGIDLDISNVLINYDLPFNPSILEQRIGRIDRMSQKNDMDIYNFHVNNTYDDRLHFILSSKLRFINFYADYGIGNPLNITSEADDTFNNFIRYFTKSSGNDKYDALMSNEDFFIASKLLRSIGVKIEKKVGLSAREMQTILLNELYNHQEEIEAWFSKGDIEQLTDEQLIAQKKTLEKLLNFPVRIRRKVVLDSDTKVKVVDKANCNPQFRKKISELIRDYSNKLSDMEITGLPMHITTDDIKDEYVFGTDKTDSFVQSSVIEVMRNEGAKVYEIG